MIGFEFGLGLFFVLICVLFTVLGSFGFGVIFVFVIGIIIMYDALKRFKKNRRTAKVGERCYARVLECTKTGNFIFNKEEYKVAVVAYIPSLRKRLFLEEAVGFNNQNEYPKDTYLSVLYDNGDINVDKKINESEIPLDIINIINEETIEKEYDEYVKEQERIKKEKEQEIQNHIENALPIIDKVQLIVKRIIIGVIIVVLFLFTIFDTAIFVQTIKAKDYIETTATFVEEKGKSEDDLFPDDVYKFIDKNEEEHLIEITRLTDYPKDEIKIKYNEKDPKVFYEEDGIMDKTELIIYIVKIVVLILLIIVFFNKKILDKINISVSG